jgi:hypothetical protein
MDDRDHIQKSARWPLVFELSAQKVVPDGSGVVYVPESGI